MLNKRFFVLATAVVVPITLITAGIILISQRPATPTLPPPEQGEPSEEPTPPEEEVASTEDPKFTKETIVSKLTKPWDMAFLTNDIFVFNERRGLIKGHNMRTGETWLIRKPLDTYDVGEGGLLGLVVDINFRDNKFIYTCMNVKGPSVTVTRWKLANNYRSAVARKDIVTGIPSNRSGRHSGCRLAMDNKAHLWIVTGDTAVGTIPQNPKSLGGKVLRVNRDGKAVPGNLTAPFDHRIFNYGHRNLQGITLFPEPVDGVYGYTAEHGTGKDDEINLLKQGNFGWDPVPGYYNESRPMTDSARYPDAVKAIWSSGDPTIAVSGMTLIKGTQWKGWNEAVLVAVLKDSHIRVFKFDSEYNLVKNKQVLKAFGRIRTVVQGPDGNIYFTTDNGFASDKIVQVKPL